MSKDRITANDWYDRQCTGTFMDLIRYLPYGDVIPMWANDIAVTCKICGTEYINPPPEMQTFPVCDRCLEFLRKLRYREHELIQS